MRGNVRPEMKRKGRPGLSNAILPALFGMAAKILPGALEVKSIGIQSRRDQGFCPECPRDAGGFSLHYYFLEARTESVHFVGCRFHGFCAGCPRDVPRFALHYYFVEASTGSVHFVVCCFPRKGCVRRNSF